MAKLVVARGEEWMGIYIDGQLIDEFNENELDLANCIQTVIDNDVTNVEQKPINLDWFANLGSYPPSITDVVWEDDEWAEGDNDPDAEFYN